MYMCGQVLLSQISLYLTLKLMLVPLKIALPSVTTFHPNLPCSGCFRPLPVPSQRGHCEAPFILTAFPFQHGPAFPLDHGSLSPTCFIQATKNTTVEIPLLCCLLGYRLLFYWTIRWQESNYNVVVGHSRRLLSECLSLSCLLPNRLQAV